MKLNKRAQNQIRNIISVFEKVLPNFYQGQPIDRWLSSYFRSNRNIGSKDRKRISNSIFGYFRWYGWIGQLFETNSSQALLLGYLLDDNPIDDTVRYWIEQHDNKMASLNGTTLKEKCRIISELIGEVSLSDLNPSFAKDWSEDLIGAFQKRPGLWVRLTESVSNIFLKDLQKKKIAYQIHPRQKQCVEIKSPINLFEFPQYKLGNMEVQDIASQGVGLLCQPKKKEIWWDICAGSGGKALHLSSLMEGEGKIYATEVQESKYKELIKRLAKRRNRDPVEAVFWNGKDIPEFDPKPNHAIVDAPCSCSGTWRRSPDLRWSTTEEKIQEYAKLQLEILSLVCQVIPGGGKLVYATCSVFEQENEQVVQKFLESHREFILNTVECPFTGLSYQKGIHLQPPEIDGNSMFVAVMQRTEFQ